MADKVGFAVAEGVTRGNANQIGAWYGDARHPEMIQPSEFQLNASERRLAPKLSKRCFKKPAKCPEYSDD